MGYGLERQINSNGAPDPALRIASEIFQHELTEAAADTRSAVQGMSALDAGQFVKAVNTDIRALQAQSNNKGTATFDNSNKDNNVGNDNVNNMNNAGNVGDAGMNPSSIAPGDISTNNVGLDNTNNVGLDNTNSVNHIGNDNPNNVGIDTTNNVNNAANGNIDSTNRDYASNTNAQVQDLPSNYLDIQPIRNQDGSQANLISMRSTDGIHSKGVAEVASDQMQPPDVQPYLGAGPNASNYYSQNYSQNYSPYEQDGQYEQPVQPVVIFAPPPVYYSGQWQPNYYPRFQPMCLPQYDRPSFSVDLDFGNVFRHRRR